MNNFENVLEKFKTSYILKKLSSFKIYRKDNEIEKNLDITKYIKFSDFNSVVIEFSELFDEHLNPEYKKIFNEKIKTLKIKRKAKKKTMPNILGSYAPEKNRIDIYGNKEEIKIDLKDRLMHELIHAASTKENGLMDGITYTQKEKTGYRTFCRSLNEGYTELLNQKYFSKNINSKYYKKELILAAGIERLINKDNMERIYFTKEMKDLLLELQKNNNDIDYNINLIFRIDNLEYEHNPKVKEQKFLTLKHEIANLNRMKLDKQYSSGDISYDEYLKSVFYDVEMYDKYGFIYDSDAKIIEEKDHYKIFGQLGAITTDNKDINLTFEPDNKYERNNIK